jgi:hypothetical protein
VEAARPDRTILMTSQQTIIFIGDLVRALKGLEAGDDSARQAIAELLGFAAPDAPVAPQSEELLPTPQLPPSLPIDPVFATAPPSATVAPEPERERRAWLPAVLDPPVDEPPALDLKAQPLDEQGLAEHDVPPTLKPLFVPNWTRAILSNAAATTSDDGPLDIERIAAVLARGEALGKLYRQPSPTLQRGVQLLVDTSGIRPGYRCRSSWSSATSACKSCTSADVQAAACGRARGASGCAISARRPARRCCC